MLRLRVHYIKAQELRYTSNLDMHKIWERTLRRAKLPLAYSQGFHPQPRLNQASPLPLGLTSLAEMIDLWLEEDLDLLVVSKMMEKAAPPGLQIQSIETIDPKEPSLPTQIESAEYRVVFLTPLEPALLSERVTELLASQSLVRERRGKTYDLRPLVQSLNVEQAELIMRLTAREGATGRAEEVVAALGFDPLATRIQRTALNLG